MLGFLGDYPLSSPSPTAIHLYPLNCSPLGSLPRLSSPSTPFRTFFCLHRLPCGFALAFLFISSVLMGFSTSVVIYLCAVTWAWCVWPLHISPLPHSVPFAEPVDCLWVWLVFLFLYRLLLSRLPLAVLIIDALSFVYAVFLACRGLPSRCYSLADSFEFFFTYAPRSHPLYPSFLLGVWARHWCLRLSTCLLALPLLLR